MEKKKLSKENESKRNEIIRTLIEGGVVSLSLNIDEDEVLQREAEIKEAYGEDDEAFWEDFAEAVTEEASGLFDENTRCDAYDYAGNITGLIFGNKQ